MNRGGRRRLGESGIRSRVKNIIKTGRMLIEARNDGKNRGECSQRIGVRSHERQLSSGCAFRSSTAKLSGACTLTKIPQKF